jgi:hypothetical protein
MVGLKAVDDPSETEWIQPGQRLGDVLVRYRTHSGEWVLVESGDAMAWRTVGASPDGRGHEAAYRLPVRDAGGEEALVVRLGFEVEDAGLRWSVSVENRTNTPVEVGDLAIPLPVNRNRGRGREAQSGPPILKHSLVSGHGSFLFWMKGDSSGPFLVLTPETNTKLEY